MNKYNIPTKSNNRICEANYCKNVATNEIKADAGKFGQLTLNHLNKLLIIKAKYNMLVKL